MSKKTSRRRFITLAVVVIIGILLSVVRFDVPFTDYTYNGFINSIPLGLDLKGGVSAVYEASLPEDDNSGDLNSAIKATVSRLQSLLESKGYKEPSVAKQAKNKIRIEVAENVENDEFFELIGKPANLKFTKENNPDAEAVMTGKHIENATVGYQNNAYGVVLTFTEEGTRLFADLTEEISGNNGTIYIYIDGEQISGMQANGAITSGSTFISGDNMNDPDSANEFAMKILSGAFNTQLKLVENNNVSALFGKNSLLLCSLAICAVVLILMLVLYILYGEMGLVANFSTLMWGILYLFFLQSVPLVQLTISGFAGLMIAVVVLFSAHMFMFENIKSEYSLGKKIPMSFKSGGKKSLPIIADTHVAVIIASVVLYLAGSAGAKSFSIVLVIGVLLSLFFSMVVTRWLLKNYLPLNSTNAKKLRLKREANVNEL